MRLAVSVLSLAMLVACDSEESARVMFEGDLQFLSQPAAEWSAFEPPHSASLKEVDLLGSPEVRDLGISTRRLESVKLDMAVIKGGLRDHRFFEMGLESFIRHVELFAGRPGRSEKVKIGEASAWQDEWTVELHIDPIDVDIASLGSELELSILVDGHSPSVDFVESSIYGYFDVKIAR